MQAVFSVVPVTVGRGEGKLVFEAGTPSSSVLQSLLSD